MHFLNKNVIWRHTSQFQIVRLEDILVGNTWPTDVIRFEHMQAPRSSIGLVSGFSRGFTPDALVD